MKKRNNSFRAVAEKMANEGIYSEISEINLHLLQRMADLNRAGFVFIDAQPIQYGSRISFHYHGNVIRATIYYSKKKGISLVVNRKTPLPAAQKLEDVFFNRQDCNHSASSRENERKFQDWIGSDESGKGDYLGPLVAAAFRVDEKNVTDLRKLGVRDSKLLSKTACRKVARKLFVEYPQRFSVVELLPETYNRMYSDFKSQGKHLNWLLAWCHAKAVSSLLDAHVEAIVIDKFARENIVRNYLKSDTPVFIRTRAEDNVAVAAASIMARARYLYRLEKLSTQFNVPLQSGAGRQTNDSAKKFVQQHGIDALHKIAKLHFKNTETIRRFGKLL